MLLIVMLAAISGAVFGVIWAMPWWNGDISAVPAMAIANITLMPAAFYAAPGIASGVFFALAVSFVIIACFVLVFFLVEYGVSKTHQAFAAQMPVTHKASIF